MALSLFIKQLLETDSIFGGEAKKLSGINDASVQVNFLGVDVVTSTTPTEVLLTVTGRGGEAPQVPSWLVVDKYVTLTIETTSISSNRQRVLSVTRNVDGFTVNFRPGETGSNTLPDVTITDTNITIDGRIWAIINDESIAREANNGSTMFNVNNSTPTGLADGSGLVQKYAAHYHSSEDSIGFEIVSHETNLQGNTLTGIDIERAATEKPVQFNRARASAEYTRFINEGEAPPEISLEITTPTGIQQTKVYYAPEPSPIVALTGLPNNSPNITSSSGIDGFSLERHSLPTSPTDATQWNFGFNVTSGDVGTIRNVNVPLPPPNFTSAGSISNSSYIKQMANAINARLGPSGTDTQDEWLAELSYAPTLLPLSSPIQPAANNVLATFTTFNTVANEFSEVIIGPNDANLSFSALIQKVDAGGSQAANQYDNAVELVSLLNLRFSQNSVTNGLVQAVRINDDLVNIVETVTAGRPRGLFNVPVRLQNRTTSDTITLFDKVPAFLVLTATAGSQVIALPLVEPLLSTQSQQKLDERRLGDIEGLQPSFSTEFELLELLERGDFFESRRDDLAKLGQITVDTVPEATSMIFLFGSTPITLNASLTSSSGTDFLVTGTSVEVANSIRDAINRNSLDIVAVTRGNEIRVGVNLENSDSLTGISSTSPRLTITPVVTNTSILSISSRLIAQGITLNFVETVKNDPTAADVWTDGVGNKLISVQIGGVSATTYQPAGPDVVFDANGNAVFNLV